MRLAVTGGIGEGKSTVLGYLRGAGYRTASADEVARIVLGSSEARDFLGFAPAPDAIRQRLTADPDFRRALNQFMHPRILAELAKLDAEVVEMPLLVEACLHPTFDLVWVVTCGQEEQLRRLANRLGGEAEAEAMRAAQLPTSVKIPFADRIVRTNSDEDSVMRYVMEAASSDLA